MTDLKLLPFLFPILSRIIATIKSSSTIDTIDLKLFVVREEKIWMEDRVSFQRDASNLVTRVMQVHSYVMAESPRRPTFAFGLDDSSPRDTRNTGNTGFFTESVPLFIATGAA